jgi:hypothetical protein
VLVCERLNVLVYRTICEGHTGGIGDWGQLWRQVSGFHDQEPCSVWFNGKTPKILQLMEGASVFRQDHQITCDPGQHFPIMILFSA